MGDVTVTAAKVAVVLPEQAEIYNVITAAAVTAGQALYQTVSGTFGLADADTLSLAGFRGIALEATHAGNVVSMLKRGVISGFTLGTYNDQLYLSDTAGALSTTPGTNLVRCGVVTALTDGKTLTEVLYVDADWKNEWEDD